MNANRIFLSFLIVGAWACKGTPPPAPVAANTPAPAAQPAAKPAPTGAPVTFGVAMTLGLQQAQRAPALISDYFSKALGRPVEVRLFTNDELADALALGTVDVAYMPPLAYVKALKKGPAQAIRRAVHHGSSSYESVLFARNDSSIKTIEDLAKKKAAWVMEGSASGNLIPRAMLMKRGIDPAKYFSDQLFLQDHSKVCEAVYEKRADVGASFADLPPAEGASGATAGTKVAVAGGAADVKPAMAGSAAPAKAELKDLPVEGCRAALGDEKVKELHVVYASEPMPNDIVALKRGTPPDLAAKITAAFDSLGPSADGQDVMHDGFHADGFVNAIPSDFSALQTLVDMYPEPQPK